LSNAFSVSRNRPRQISVFSFTFKISSTIFSILYKAAGGMSGFFETQIACSAKEIGDNATILAVTIFQKLWRITGLS
jgi:hypothetical protein